MQTRLQHNYADDGGNEAERFALFGQFCLRMLLVLFKTLQNAGMEEMEMKYLLFVGLFLAVLTFGKGFVGSFNKTLGNVQTHNAKIDFYYASMKK